MGTAPPIPQIDAAPVAVSTPRKRTIFDNTIIGKIRELNAQGVSVREIAETLGVSRQAIGNWHVKLNLTFQRPKLEAAKTSERIPQLRDLHARGMTALEIARALHVSSETSYRLHRTAELVPNRKPGVSANRDKKETGKVVVIKITTGMRKSADEAGITIAQYFVDLYLTDVAQRNQKRLCQNAKPQTAQIFKQPAPAKEEKRYKIDAARVQMILHLLSQDSHAEEPLSVGEIAKRCGVSITSVRRIRDTFRASEIRVPGAQRRNREKSWSWKEGQHAESSEASA